MDTLMKTLLSNKLMHYEISIKKNEIAQIFYIYKYYHFSFSVGLVILLNTKTSRAIRMNADLVENEVPGGTEDSSEKSEDGDDVIVDLDISISSISDTEGEVGDNVWQMPCKPVSVAQAEKAQDPQGSGSGRLKKAHDKKADDAPKVIPAVKPEGSQGKNHQEKSQSAGTQKNNNKNSTSEEVNQQYKNCKNNAGQGTSGDKNLSDQQNKNSKNTQNQQNKNNPNQQNSNTKNTANQQQNNKSNESQQNNSNKNNNNKSNNSKMKKEEGGGYGMFAQLKSIFSRIVRRDESTPEIVDSFVLRMHYCLGVSVFILAFSVVQANWFTKEAVHCVFGHNAEKAVAPAIKNTCLSYAYTCQAPMSTMYDGEDCPRQYLLFYRWIHFSFLILAGVHYLPRIVAKKASHSPLKKLLANLISMERRYDDSAFETGVKKMVTYFENHFYVHGSLYTRFVMCHVIALVIDIASFIYLDFFMQENFIGLVYNSYPFHRNPRNFSDNLYQVFPPFAFCSIDEYNLINNARVDVLHCHLLLMELYEKVFVVLWVLLAFLMFLASLSVVVLLFISLPPFNRVFLFTFTSSKRIRKIKKKVRCIFGYGDLHVMHMMKCHVSEGQFVTFLAQLVENSRLKFDGLFPCDKDGVMMVSAVEDPNSTTVPRNQPEPRCCLPSGTLQPEAILTLPNDSLLPDLHCQSGNRPPGHTSSTPKPKTRLLPPFFKSEKHADLYPIIEISP